ncbi:MAG: hypothetical protein AAB802_00280 [Patescibacteria group bacterium]
MGFLDTVKGLFGGRKGPAEAPITGEAPAAPSAIQEKLQALIKETDAFAGRVKDVMAQPNAAPTAAPAPTPPLAPVAPVEAIPAAPVTPEVAPAAPVAPSAGVLAEMGAPAPVATPETPAPVVNPMPINASLGTPVAIPTPANDVKMPEAPTVQEHEGQQAA